LLAAAGVLLIPLAWFLVPELTSHSWFIAGDLALNKGTVIHGDKFIGVIGRLLGLYEWPMWVAVGLGLVMALARRDRAALGLAVAAWLWVVFEIGFALHGWSAVPRYLIEPMAVLVVLGGAGVGWTLAYVPSFAGPALRWLPTVGILAIVVALVPVARARARSTHGQIDEARVRHLAFTRLVEVVRTVGGPARLKACGQPVTALGDQSEVAWTVGLNVGNVGWDIGWSTNQRIPIVVINPRDDGWQMRPIRASRAIARNCAALRTDTAMGPPR
jgi:hypothetical protein